MAGISVTTGWRRVRPCKKPLVDLRARPGEQLGCGTAHALLAPANAMVFRASAVPRTLNPHLTIDSHPCGLISAGLKDVQHVRMHEASDAALMSVVSSALIGHDRQAGVQCGSIRRALARLTHLETLQKRGD
jgi:hypothetical protein